MQNQPDLEAPLTGAAQSPDLERALTRNDLGRAREGGGRAVRDGHRKMAASRGEVASGREEVGGSAKLDLHELHVLKK